jgi:hypothetical protein
MNYWATFVPFRDLFSWDLAASHRRLLRLMSLNLVINMWSWLIYGVWSLNLLTPAKHLPEFSPTSRYLLCWIMMLSNVGWKSSRHSYLKLPNTLATTSKNAGWCCTTRWQINMLMTSSMVGGFGKCLVSTKLDVTWDVAEKGNWMRCSCLIPFCFRWIEFLRTVGSQTFLGALIDTFLIWGFSTSPLVQ